MRIEINLQDDLPRELKDKVKRQVAFKLQPKSTSVETVRVTLKTLNFADDDPWYVCSMSAKLKKGSNLRAQFRGRQPNICIADTASRLSRTIAREVQQLGTPVQADIARH